MGRLAALLVTLLIAAGLFWSATRTPVPANPCPTCFHAERALADIRVIAARPHPVGSAANQAVRDYLMGRLTDLRLSPRIQRARVWEQEPGLAYISVATVENVVVVLPGRNPELPAVALMAHYDSVPGSPGAGDDAAGVAVALDIVRSFTLRGQRPIRDVVLVFTDGEEAGTLGARGFFALDPLARHIGFVLNLDNRGSSGRAMMYETNDGPAGAIALYANTAPAPRSHSLLPLVYRYLPYGSDFTRARDRGIQGLNFSFIGGESDYHTPAATVDRLSLGAVQSEGAQAHAIAERLAYTPDWPTVGPSRVWADLLGWRVIAYSTGFGWLILAAGAGLLAWAIARARRLGPIGWRDAAAGAGVSLYALTLAAALMTLAQHLAADPQIGRAALLPRFPVFEVMLVLIGLGAAILAVSGAVQAGRRWRWLALLGFGAGAAASLLGELDPLGLGLGLAAAVLALSFRRASAAPAAWAGALMLQLLLGALLQIAAPEAAPMVVWPAVGAGAAAALTALGAGSSGWRWLPAVGLCAVTVAWIGVFTHMAAQSLDLAAILGVAAWLAMTTLWPFATTQRRALAAGAGLIAIGLLGALAMRLTPPFTAGAPRAVAVYHITDTRNGQAWRATFSPPEPWMRAALGADGHPVTRQTFAVMNPRPAWAARTRPLPSPIAAPAFRLMPSADGRQTLTIIAPPGARTLYFRLSAAAPLQDVRLENVPTTLLRRTDDSTLIWRAPENGSLTLSFAAPTSGALDIHYTAQNDPWPSAAAPLPPPPPGRIYGVRFGAQVTIGEAHLAWGRPSRSSAAP